MKPILYLSMLLLLFSCKENTYIYELNDLEIQPNNAGKTKEKSQEQFINVAHANLYQTALAPNQLVAISDVITSIGDKQVAIETVIAKMMSDPNVQLPSNSEMRADLPYFVEETYKRFFVRIPTEAEKTFFINFIQSNPQLEPEHVYFAFATSNEYYHY
jgi:hypothetical protein